MENKLEVQEIIQFINNEGFVFNYEPTKWKDVKVGDIVSDGPNISTEVAEKMDEYTLKVLKTWPGVRAKVGDIIDFKRSDAELLVYVVTNYNN